MNKPTLLILAAGIGSRYGGNKQIEGFGPREETIMEYSIFDAIKAGFGRVVFIVREEILEMVDSTSPYALTGAIFAQDREAIITASNMVKEMFVPKLKGKVEIDFVVQSLDSHVPPAFQNKERKKPFGTGHAVLCAKEAIHEPFAVINADDFYGFDAFRKMADFLTKEVSDEVFSLMGYRIDRTLSDHGSVSRGVCVVDSENYMTGIDERTKVYFKNVNGERKIFYEEEGQEHELPSSRMVSMNFWGFNPSVFPITEKLFKEFVHQNEDNPKAEFFIPLVADALIKSGQVQFKVIPTDEKWFGVTYKEDKAIVEDNLARLVREGVYPEKLF